MPWDGRTPNGVGGTALGRHIISGKRRNGARQALALNNPDFFLLENDVPVVQIAGSESG
jgi:hypothetical protein